MPASFPRESLWCVCVCVCVCMCVCVYVSYFLFFFLVFTKVLVSIKFRNKNWFIVPVLRWILSIILCTVDTHDGSGVNLPP